ncbi:ABC-2 family transporter protein [compost metagenome]
MRRIGIRQVKAVVGYEWQMMLRSRWLAAFAALFVILGVFLSYWNHTLFSSTGASGMTRQSMMLLNMVLQLAPLMGVLLSSLSLSGERSDGMTRLLHTYPLTETQYVIGKFLGLFLALICAVLAGTMIAYVSLAVFGQGGSLQAIGALLLTSIPLLSAFSSLGLWLGSRVRSRLNAIAGSLFLWFFLVYIYGMGVMAALPILPRTMQEGALAILLTLNPVEAVRIGAVFWQGQGYIYGPTFYYWEQAIRSPVGMIGSVVLVILYSTIPLFFAMRKLRKGE